MPKLLVLFQSHDPEVARLAAAAADGARRVRFAEVDLRRLATSDAVGHDADGRGTRLLERVHDIAAYDGLILVVAHGAGAGAELVRGLGTFDGSLENKVGCVLSSAVGSDRPAVLWSVLTPMADRGMILVPAPFGDHEPAEAARRTGTRVAEVIGWVTHARSHHHHDQHAHDECSHHDHRA
jgi:hypothetical protein